MIGAGAMSAMSTAKINPVTPTPQSTMATTTKVVAGPNLATPAMRAIRMSRCSL